MSLFLGVHFQIISNESLYLVKELGYPSLLFITIS